ncbi:hypothetical protein [Novosphingobium mathurense]|uniref:Uncharacterized protein n=1 Tax=Novosphingobium mathurense TaxID=428990 RepID=A0A1U6I7M6_9SPHN|nr:hypothetical protein [Novosphingobium mathurense]SLK04001.1 hypothetical protein SAMN06295987_104322 [Novosphingobium mathurense]
MRVPENPPAFPHELPSGGSVSGMSLRDWFAGQALGGMLASEGDQSGYYHDAAFSAQRAYSLADAMLAERDRP